MKNLETTILSCKKGVFLSVTTLVSADKINQELAKRGFKGGNPMLDRITKSTEYVGVRICDYERLSDVIAERLSGKEAKEPWYEWEENSFPYICKAKKSEKRYFVIKPTENTTYNTKWYLDGKEISLEEIKPYFKPSYFAKKEDAPRMFTLQLEFITSIKQGNLLYQK